MSDFGLCFFIFDTFSFRDMCYFCVHENLKRILEGWVKIWETSVRKITWETLGPMEEWWGTSPGQRRRDWGLTLGSRLLWEAGSGSQMKSNLRLHPNFQSSLPESSKKPQERYKPPTTWAPHWDPQDWDLGMGTPRAFLEQITKPGSPAWFLCRQPFQFWLSTYLFPRETRWEQHHLCLRPLGLFFLSSWVTWRLYTITSASSSGTGKQLSGCLQGSQLSFLHCLIRTKFWIPVYSVMLINMRLNLPAVFSESSIIALNRPHEHSCLWSRNVSPLSYFRPLGICSNMQNRLLNTEEAMSQDGH